MNKGGSSEELQKAHEFLQLRKDVEESNSWAIHRTNQVSDDHVLGSHGIFPHSLLKFKVDILLLLFGRVQTH